MDPVDDLAARFVACTLPHAEWTHAAHLTVGTWHVRRFGPAEALNRLRVGIRRLNDSHGTLNTADSGYHETITVAYVHLLAEFVSRFADDVPTGDVVEQLLAGPLADRDALLAFFSRGALFSPEARAGRVEPDLAPLSLARLIPNA